MTRMSDSDPLRVDFVDPATHALPGRLGVTSAPGRSVGGLYAIWDRDLATDLERLRREYDTRVLVTLLERFEMARAGIPDLLDAARRAGMKSLWLPIRDGSTPPEPEDAFPLVREILEHLAAGETVVVHCMGGLGRSGTIAACALVARGVAPGRAVEEVRVARPGALESSAQVAFVRSFGDAWRAHERQPSAR